MGGKPEITVVVPFHTQRETNGYLQRAIRSIENQTFPRVQVIAVRDEKGQGAPATRNHGLMLVDTPWVAFLDSDDEMDPGHLEKLYGCAQESDADYVYSWFRIRGGGYDPFPQFFGKPWDDAEPHHTTITTMVRTGLAQSVGFMKPGMEEAALRDHNRMASDEDWQFTLGCLEAGAKIVHHPERTWTWYHHGANTSGIPGRGDAR